jgi:hypothetical protein
MPIVGKLNRTWSNMKNSVSMAMSLSMYGFSTVVLDQCGGIGKLDEEMCARWMQLSVMMPMTRNFIYVRYLDPITGQMIPTDSANLLMFKDETFQYMGVAALH